MAEGEGSGDTGRGYGPDVGAKVLAKAPQAEVLGARGAPAKAAVLGHGPKTNSR